MPLKRQAHRGEGAISALALTFRFAIATVLAVAAFAKARSFDSFRTTVGALVPRRRGVTWVAVGVVATEGALAALLASGLWASAVAAVTVALFLGFAAVSLWAARRGLRVQCNCFGAGDRELGRDSLETSLLLAGATLAYWALLQRVEPSLTFGEVPLAVFLGIAAVLGARWGPHGRKADGNRPPAEAARPRARRVGAERRSMTTLLVVCVVVLGVLVVVQGLVLLEMVRQTAQIRRVLDLDDRSTPISLGSLAGRPPPEPAGALWSQNGGSRDGVVVLLSTDCATCRLVASGLRDLLDRFEQYRIVTVLQAHNGDEAAEMLAAAGLAQDEIVLDLEREYGAALGIALRPAAVVVRDGIVSEGATVRNARQLQQLLEALESSRREVVEV